MKSDSETPYFDVIGLGSNSFKIGIHMWYKTTLNIISHSSFITYTDVCVYLDLVSTLKCPWEGLMETSDRQLVIFSYTSETLARMTPKDSHKIKRIGENSKGIVTQRMSTKIKEKRWTEI